MQCTSCLIDVLNLEDKQPALIPLKDFMVDPVNGLMKITKINESKDKINEMQQIELMEKMLSQFEETVKKVLATIRQNIKQLKTQFEQVASEIYNNLKLNDVVSQFYLLGQMDSYQGTKEQLKLEEQLNHISMNLNKTYIEAKEKLKVSQILIQKNIYNNLELIQNQADQVTKASFNIVGKIIFQGMPEIISQELDQFPEIHQLISQGKQIEYQLLYQGTVDGLNAESYWTQCVNQSNLLTIMTSRNGNKFGGYSPCVISNGNYVQDPTMQSFMFQYNKKQIYKLKNQKQAIFCAYEYGPTYGGGHDLHITKDFKNGYSDLGHSYDTSGYNIVDKANHLFGAAKPQLQECKVYKVIF